MQAFIEFFMQSRSLIPKLHGFLGNFGPVQQKKWSAERSIDHSI